MKLDMSPKKEDKFYIYVFKSLVTRYSQDGVGQIGGQLAYFCILSIFPFLIFVNAFIARLKLPLRSWIEGMKEILPPDIIEIVISYIEHIDKYSDMSIMSIGLLITVYLASKSSMSLIHAISRAYRIEDCGFIRKVLLSIFITIMLGFSVILSLVFITFGRDMIVSLLEFLRLPLVLASVWTIIRWLIAPIAMFVTLSTIFYVTPSRKSRYREIIPGTLFSIVGFFVMTIIFSIYVNHFANYSGVYGSLGGIIIFLVWLYSSGIVIVMGAELNHTLVEWKKK